MTIAKRVVAGITRTFKIRPGSKEIGAEVLGYARHIQFKEMRYDVEFDQFEE